MTLDEGDVSILDPFTHIKDDRDKIRNFNFWEQRQKKENTEKVKIDETFCTLVTVGGQFLEKKTFDKVIKKIDDIRRIIRV